MEEVTKIIDLIYLAKQSGLNFVLNEQHLQLKVQDNKIIDPDLLEEIRNNKQQIIDFLSNENWKTRVVDENHNKINKFDRKINSQFPLSFSQERLWFIDQLEGSVQYHVPIVRRLKGKLNKEALANAFQGIINRHEVLRTVIIEKEGQGYPSIIDVKGWQLSIVDGSIYKENSDELQLSIKQIIINPFDLSKDYMIRASLITFSEQENILVVTLHHIASDGWSTSVLFKELMEFYNAYIEDRPVLLSSLPIQYEDYAIWQRNYLQGEILDRKVGYWKEKLKNVGILQLPVDYHRPAEWSNRGALLRFSIDKFLSDQLHALSKQESTTLFMTLLAAFKVLLHRYSGQEDICIGSPIANRSQKELEGLIGFFVNTIAIRSEIKPDLSFKELLQKVRAVTLEAYEHQDVPFEKVVEAVVKERDMSRNPVFQVMLVMQNNPKVQTLRLGEVELSAEGYTHETAQFDITFSIIESIDGLRILVEYATDLYSEATIIRMMDHFKTLLSSIVNAPHQKIGMLPMLTMEEEHQLLYTFNDTKVDYPKDKTIIKLFEEQSAKTPEAIAVVFEEEQLTYKQLNEKANKLAHFLRGKGVKEDTLVPICIERGMMMIIGILGILKSGGAYVPVDPEYPQERINYMLEDTGAAILVSSQEGRSELKTSGVIEIIELDKDWETISSKPIYNLQTSVQPHNLAYVTYTSGSTGKPKGVMIEHASLINYVLAFSDYFSLCSKDVVIQQASISFDTSAEEIYPTLIAGGCICIIKEGGKDIDNIKKYIENDGATILSTTPMVIEWLNNESLITNKLRYLISGGDVLHSSNINNLFQKVTIINGYGPSEATIAATFKKINSISKASLIGKPIANTAIYILGPYNNLTPIGIVGEICIGGSGLARGYLNNSALTKEKFIPNPFSKDPNSRIYKTGDYGRWLADGNIEYIGRADSQVKIRGYRIELGEIESVLQQSKLVSQAVVKAKKDIKGNNRLVGYIVPEGPLNREAIKSYLKNKLPEYMIPTVWVELEKLPLTPNGKIDKKSFPDFDAEEVLNENYVAPRNDTERIIAEIWEQVLEVEKVGINNNFFELGGHSLIILKLASKIRKLGLKIEVKDFFKYQTIEQQSNFIQTSLKLLHTASEGKFVIPIQPEGNNFPLFGIPEFLLYSEIGKYISKEQPFYSIEHSPYKSVAEVVNHYVTEIKKTYPHGPYGLMGYCSWGDVILQMAQKLIAQGDDVPVLVLTEYYSPSIAIPRFSIKYLLQKIVFIIKKLRENGPLINKGKFISKELKLTLRFIERKFKKSNPKENAPVITYKGKVILFQASETYGFKDDSHMGWSEIFTGEVKKFVIKGDHLEMMASPVAAAQMAEILNKGLSETNTADKKIK